MLLLVILQILSQSTYGEYHIRSGLIGSPSFLYGQFANVKENVFPREIKIIATFTRLEGTLLYSIDRRMNQLIVTLRGDPDELIEIEFSKQRHALPLSEICGCHRCRNERLEIIIRLMEKMFVQCNYRGNRKIKLNITSEINEDYPNPYKSKQIEKSNINEGNLWIVNTGPFGEIYPNGRQLTGCIYSVTYNGREIKFKEVTPNIGSKCIKTCTDHICNGGRCCETFKSEYFCNCTESYMNGPGCNDVLKSINARCSFPPSMFEMVKLSWQSSSNDIFILQNKNIRIRVYRDDTLLILTYSAMTGFLNGVTNRRILLSNYIPGRKYVLVVEFYEDKSYFKLFHNNIWYTEMITNDKDLRQEIFKSMILRSGEGTIEMAYRTSHHDCSWKKIKILKCESLTYDDHKAKEYTVSKTLNQGPWKASFGDRQQL